jgi:hypothetical protein
MQWLLALVPVIVASGGAAGYKRVGGAHGVEVYRATASKVIDLSAEGDIDAPPGRVLAVVLDYEHASALTEHVAESRVLSTGDRDLTVYQRLKLPVVADRDYTLRTRWGRRGGWYWARFFVDNARGPNIRNGVVRVPLLDGGWDLFPNSDGRSTHAVYRVRIDLAGSIPRWMVSGGAAKDLPKLFEGVRRHVHKNDLGATRDCSSC